jgi:hypothetical protein
VTYEVLSEIDTYQRLRNTLEYQVRKLREKWVCEGTLQKDLPVKLDRGCFVTDEMPQESHVYLVSPISLANWNTFAKYFTSLGNLSQ